MVSAIHGLLSGDWLTVVVSAIHGLLSGDWLTAPAMSTASAGKLTAEEVQSITEENRQLRNKIVCKVCMDNDVGVLSCNQRLCDMPPTHLRDSSRFFIITFPFT